MLIDQEEFDRAVEILRGADFIYIIGNGGSASLANHLACDLLKNTGLKAISLCSNEAVLTAIGNDQSFEEIFCRQLEILFNRERDVLIALSTSGQSLNVVLAAKYIYESGGKVIAIGGNKGGKLKKYATIPLILKSEGMQNCEDKMAGVCHELYRELAIGK